MCVSFGRLTRRQPRCEKKTAWQLVESSGRLERGWKKKEYRIEFRRSGCFERGINSYDSGSLKLLPCKIDVGAFEGNCLRTPSSFRKREITPQWNIDLYSRLCSEELKYAFTSSFWTPIPSSNLQFDTSFVVFVFQQLTGKVSNYVLVPNRNGFQLFRPESKIGVRLRARRRKSRASFSLTWQFLTNLSYVRVLSQRPRDWGKGRQFFHRVCHGDLFPRGSHQLETVKPRNSSLGKK